MKKTLLLIGLLFIGYFGWEFVYPQITALTKPFGDVVTLKINDTVVVAEVAGSLQSRATGLMNRTYLAPDNGMFFVFPTQGNHSFWMKNTLIPLDIIWIDEDFRVVHIAQGVPPCAKTLCPSYASTSSARYVLEVNSGWVLNNGVRVGDIVMITSQNP